MNDEARTLLMAFMHNVLNFIVLMQFWNPSDSQYAGLQIMLSSGVTLFFYFWKSGQGEAIAVKVTETRARRKTPVKMLAAMSLVPMILGFTGDKVEAVPIVYQQVRCGEDRDIYGRINFPPGTASFSVYLEARVASTNNPGFDWVPVINSHDNIAPAPTDTSSDFGPLDTANAPSNADRLRVVNTQSDDASDPVIPCQLGATATPSPAPTQTPVVLIVTATATITPVPTATAVPTQAPITVIVNVPPQAVAPVQSFPTFAPVQPIAPSVPVIRPPSTGNGGLVR